MAYLTKTANWIEIQRELRNLGVKIESRGSGTLAKLVYGNRQYCFHMPHKGKPVNLMMVRKMNKFLAELFGSK